MTSHATGSMAIFLFLVIAGVTGATPDEHLIEEAGDGLMSVRGARTEIEQVSSDSKPNLNLRELLGAKNFRTDKILAEIQQGGMMTPEVAQTLDGMVQLVENTVERAIIRDHNNAQQKLSRAIAFLGNQTIHTDSVYSYAKNLDEQYVQCIEREEELGNNYTHCIEVLENRTVTREALCPPANESAIKTYNLTVEQTVTCHFQTDPYCEIAWAPFIAMIRSKVQMMKNPHEVDDAVHWAFWDECLEAAHAEKVKDQECEDLELAWTATVGACETLNTDRSVAMCTFGEEYQKKCGAEDDYLKIKQAVDADLGTEIEDNRGLSEADRQAEWRAIATLKCMIDKFEEDNPDFNTATMRDCEQLDDNYSTSVGVMDLLEADYANIMSHRTFSHTTCDDGQFEFSSSGYTIDPSDVAERVIGTAIYTRHENLVYEVNVSHGSQAATNLCPDSTDLSMTFQRLTCGEMNYQCPAHTVNKPADTECVLLTACLVTDCCQSNEEEVVVVWDAWNFTRALALDDVVIDLRVDLTITGNKTDFIVPPGNSVSVFSSTGRKVLSGPEGTPCLEFQQGSSVKLYDIELNGCGCDGSSPIFMNAGSRVEAWNVAFQT